MKTFNLRFILVLSTLAAELASAQTISFGPVASYPAGTDPRSAGVGDFNGDGKPDLAVVDRTGNNVSVLLNTGSGSFGAATSFAVGTTPMGIAVADFNGDGKLDLAVGNSNSNSISVLLGNGAGGFGSAINAAVDCPANLNGSLGVGDFNGDGKLDLAVAVSCFHRVGILLGNGDGRFGSATYFDVQDSPQAVAAADFNGDGRLDLAVVNNYPGVNTVSVLIGNGDGTFGLATNYAVGSQPIAVVAGDFNGDGKRDLAVANEIGGTVSILLGNGNGTFNAASSVLVATAGNPSSVATADLNADGKLDLAVSRDGAGEVLVLTGNGDGTFGPASHFALPNSSWSVSVADLNGDGKLDLALTVYAANEISILLSTAQLPVSAGDSQVVASPTSVPADGSSTATISVTLKGVNGNPVSGKTVSIAATGGSSTITPVSSTTDSFGQATFTVKDTVTETVTYSATDTSDAIRITQTAAVTFTVPTLYAAQIQQPINADGSSVFNANRGVVPVKFTLTIGGVSTCSLPAATIAVFRVANNVNQPIDESEYSMQADNGSNFRITDCQYVYNQAVSTLGPGSYLVQILINGNPVGSAKYGLK